MWRDFDSSIQSVMVLITEGWSPVGSLTRALSSSCLGSPEVILKVLTVLLHILRGEDLLVVEPHEEGQVCLLLHKLRVVLLLLYDSVADCRREIRVAPHPDGDIKVRGLRGRHIVIRVHDDNLCHGILCFID